MHHAADIASVIISIKENENKNFILTLEEKYNSSNNAVRLMRRFLPSVTTLMITREGSREGVRVL